MFEYIRLAFSVFLFLSQGFSVQPGLSWNYVDPTGLKRTEILLPQPQPLKCWD